MATIFKLDGAGNDFLGLDARGGADLPRRDQIPPWCDRTDGIGADGVLLVETPTLAGADVRMRYFNSDGTEAAMCGNGARCFALLARELGFAREPLCIQTAAGQVEARILARDPETGTERVELSFPGCETSARPIPVVLSGQLRDAAFVSFGVPHLVVWLDEPAAPATMDAWGRSLRRLARLGPDGANVNFAWPAADGAVRYATFERGVEGITRACGTGAVAVAVSHASRNSLRGRERFLLLPPGGEALVVTACLESGGVARELSLRGPARMVRIGEFEQMELPRRRGQPEHPSFSASAVAD